MQSREGSEMEDEEGERLLGFYRHAHDHATTLFTWSSMLLSLLCSIVILFEWTF